MREAGAHAGTEAADDGIEDAVVRYRAAAGDGEKSDAQEHRCIFISTRTKTIRSTCTRNTRWWTICGIR